MSDLMIFVIAYFVAGLMVATGSCDWSEIKRKGIFLIVSYYLVLVPSWPFAVIKAVIHVILGWYRSGYCTWCGHEFPDHKIESIQAHFLVCEKHPDNQLILKYKTALESIADPRTLYIMECIEMDGLTGFEATAKRALINDPK